jgi:hypothetical protein
MESLTTGPELENSQDLLPLPGAVLVHLAEQELTLGGLPCWSILEGNAEAFVHGRLRRDAKHAGQCG